MGRWDEFCLVCGGPACAPEPELHDVFEEVGEAKGRREPLKWQGFEWLDKYVGINEAEELIPLGGYADYGYFHVPNRGTTQEFGGATNVQNLHEVEPNLFGLCCHEKCYRLLERDLGYTLRFHDVWPLLMEQDFGGHLEDYTDYGGMEAYHNQFFMFRELFLDGKEWMLRDPMTDCENAERILKVWRPIVQMGFKVSKRNRRGESHDSPAAVPQPVG